jgi:hypothetical protein
MPHILIRHKVADFDQWRQIFDSRAGVRKLVGLKEERFWRSAADPNDIFILFAADNLQTAMAYVNSPEVLKRMKSAGVIGQPDIQVLLQQHDR